MKTNLFIPPFFSVCKNETKSCRSGHNTVVTVAGIVNLGSGVDVPLVSDIMTRNGLCYVIRN